jgi:LacI family transcriptional regulator
MISRNDSGGGASMTAARSKNGGAGPSISDVARLSSTSVATVSRVLSDSDHPVAFETRRRVREAAASLGYKPNAIARALATQRTRTIGLIVGDIADSYFAEIARGVEDTAGPHGYLTILCNADRNPDTELAYFRMLLDHKVAAVMFAGGLFGNLPEMDALRQAVQRAQEEGRRVMVLAPRDFPNVQTIAIDNRAVTYDMTRYLIQLGHRTIAYVGGPEGMNTAVLRREGFIRAMNEAGLDASTIYNEGFGFDAGEQAATTILSRSLPDAILTATDDCAIGLLMTLRAAGIDIPGQVSVAGVDDSRLASLFDLTTVKIPKYELGVVAARRFLEAGEEPPQSTILPHKIVARRSTSFRRPDPEPREPPRRGRPLRDAPA